MPARFWGSCLHVPIFWADCRSSGSDMAAPCWTPTLTECTSGSALTHNAGYISKAPDLAHRHKHSPALQAHQLPEAPLTVHVLHDTHAHTSTRDSLAEAWQHCCYCLALVGYVSVQQPVLSSAEHVKAGLRLSEVILRDPGFGCYFQAVLKMLEF